MKTFIFLDDADTTNPRIVMHVNGNHMFLTVAEALKIRRDIEWAVESLSNIQKHSTKEKYRESL